jgi:hypothetical protein
LLVSLDLGSNLERDCLEVLQLHLTGDHAEDLKDAQHMLAVRHGSF